MLKSLSIFSGSANPQLCEEICDYLEVPMGRAKFSHFSDGETYVEIQENVRGVNCFVVQPTSQPVNENLMELLIAIDALRRSSAGSIIAIIPSRKRTTPSQRPTRLTRKRSTRWARGLR